MGRPPRAPEIKMPPQCPRCAHSGEDWAWRDGLRHLRGQVREVQRFRCKRCRSTCQAPLPPPFRRGRLGQLAVRIMETAWRYDIPAYLVARAARVNVNSVYRQYGQMEEAFKAHFRRCGALTRREVAGFLLGEGMPPVEVEAALTPDVLGLLIYWSELDASGHRHKLIAWDLTGECDICFPFDGPTTRRHEWCVAWLDAEKRAHPEVWGTDRCMTLFRRARRLTMKPVVLLRMLDAHRRMQEQSVARLKGRAACTSAEVPTQAQPSRMEGDSAPGTSSSP